MLLLLSLAIVLCCSRYLLVCAMVITYCYNLLLLLFLQAIFLVEEGALPEEVDQVIEDFGIPGGPFKIMDLSGNSTIYD